jgi:hypothetical protein
MSDYRIHTDSVSLFVHLDPASGTLARDITVDQAEIENIVVTASGGDVAVTGIMERDKYPFGDLANNQYKCRFRLSRRIVKGETVTITLPAALFTDGSITSPAVTSAGVTNESYWYTAGSGIDAQIDNTYKLLYVDPSTGNDTNAALVNSGDGYYTTDDTEIAGGIRAPSGITPYATLDAAGATVGTNEKVVVLFRNGQTFDGSVHRIAGTSNYMIGFRSGPAVATPWIYTGYGAGARPILQGGATNGTRVYSGIHSIGNQVIDGLDIQVGSGTDALRFAFGGTSGTFGNIGFVRCKIEKGVFVPSTAGTGARVWERVGFIDNEIDNMNTASGFEGSDDWDDFGFREWSWIDNDFRNVGDASGLEHPLYLKAFGDVAVCGNIFDNCNGVPVKVDSCWGIEISGNVSVNGGAICNIESNGDTDAGIPTDRSRVVINTEYPVSPFAGGAHSRWCYVGKNVVTDVPDGGVQCSIVSKLGTCYDVTVEDNVLVNSSTGTPTIGVLLARNGGSSDGGYTCDSQNVKVQNNTTIVTATDTVAHSAVRITCADTDTFNSTNNTSKGHQGLDISRNLMYVGSGATGSDVTLVSVVFDSWSDAETLGRLDGAIQFNSGWTGDSSETNFYRDDSTYYSTAAAWQTAVNATSTVATGTRFENPGFTSLGYEVSDYASDRGFGSLSAMIDAIAAGRLAGTLPDNLKSEAIAAAVIAAHTPESLSAANYGGTLPGASTAPAAATPGLAVTDPDDEALASGGTYNGPTDIAFGADVGFQFTLTNDGDAANTLGTITVGTGYTIDAGDNPSGDTIAAGGTATLTIKPVTSAPGVRSAVVTVPSDDPDSPYTFTVTATVQEAIAVTVLEQLPSVRLGTLRRKIATPRGHVPIILVGDSNCEDRHERMVYGMRRMFATPIKKIPISPNTGGATFFPGGTGSSFIDVGGAAGTGTNIVPGDTGALGVGRLTGLAGGDYRYPCRALRHVWDTEFDLAHTSRLIIAQLTHGEQMVNGATGATGATYALGDPTLGQDIRFYWSELVNEDGDDWSQQIQTDFDPEGDGTWANAQIHGYATDPAVPGTALGIKVWSRALAAENTGTGMSARIKHTSTDLGDRLGRELYLTTMWHDIESVEDGISIWPLAIGGWNTRNHMPPTVGELDNSDANGSKYDVAKAAEWVAKCVAPDCEEVIVRIQLGQNAIASGDFAEGAGTDTGRHLQNQRDVLAHLRNIMAAAGKRGFYWFSSSQNTIIGGDRFRALAEDLRAIALTEPDVAFFDLRGAIIDGGHADEDQRMKNPELTNESERVHTNAAGGEILMGLEWAAISTAPLRAPPRGRASVRTRGTALRSGGRVKA